MADKKEESVTHTMPFGADTKKADAKPSSETARQFAERTVIEQNGEYIRNNQNFEQLVDDAEKQIEANRKNTEGM